MQVGKALSATGKILSITNRTFEERRSLSMTISYKKERGKIRVDSSISVHYLVAFAAPAVELIIFTAAGC
jgi:hypothetical protein